MLIIQFGGSFQQEGDSLAAILSNAPGTLTSLVAFCFYFLSFFLLIFVSGVDSTHLNFLLSSGSVAKAVP